MCGFTGFVDFNKKTTRKHLINAANTLVHRGPDDGGEEIMEMHDATLGFGHKRLSILDISQLGHQPMFNKDKSILLMLNGTVYNYREIKKELEEIGYGFTSSSDTEVILKAYEQYGAECLNKFIGMFALVICDTNKQKLFLIRDRTGIKPLYYYFKDGCLLFGSELKPLHQYPSFKKEICQEALSLYFKYGYIRAPYSIFKNTYKLEAGHYAIFDIADRSLKLHQYWNVLDYYNKPEININEQEAIDSLETLCSSAFQYRMVSDVPVGVFLSGGYDSALVTAILQKHCTDKIKTFTIGFNESTFNEAHHAQKIASYLGTDHHEYYCTVREAQDIIPVLPFYYDEPFGDSSAIPTILVSRFARKNVTVALSADGGDEIFAGYSRYDQLLKLKKIKRSMPLFVQKGSARMLNFFPKITAKQKKIAALLSENSVTATSNLLNSHFLNDDLKELLKYSLIRDVELVTASMLPTGGGFLNSILAADYKTYLADDILVKVDRASMSAGLEGRAPLLDHRIIEWAAQLPTELKYHNGDKKYLVKKLTHKYISKEIIDRPKMGFGIPLENWLKGDLSEIVKEALSNDNIRRYDILNEAAVAKLRDNYYYRNTNNHSQLWLVFMFQLWCNEWM